MLNDIKAFLLSLFEKIRLKKLIKRFAWLILICLLTILIPVSIALCYIYFVKEAPKFDSPKISATLFDIEKTKIASDETQEDIIDSSPLVKLLYDLSSSKVHAEKPSAFSETQNFSFIIIYGEKSSTFNCYFKEDPAKSYLEDENGKFYSPDTLAYSNFLNSPYAETIYKESAPPALFTANKSNITPHLVDWNYTLNNGQTKKSKNYVLTDEILTYRITGAIKFEFSRIPDICEFEVRDTSGKIVFSGNAQELYTMTATEGDEFLISISAKWEQSEFSSFGEQKYEFKIICSEPSSFSLSSTQAFGGQFILITVTDVDTADSVIYSVINDDNTDISNAQKENYSKAELDSLEELLTYKPTFVKEGNNAYAFLPIPRNIPDMSFKFSLSCGISKADFTLLLKKASTTDVTVTSGDDFEKVTIIDAQKAEFSRIILSLNHSDHGMILFRDKFLSPEEYGFKLSHSYNNNVNSSFVLLANSYASDTVGGSAVQSAGIGIVSATGPSELLGTYVIVDHGMGLYSWYCGLSDVNVSIGDVLKKGDVLGRSGSTSLLCENGVNVIFSIYGKLIDPNDVLGKELISFN